MRKSGAKTPSRRKDKGFDIFRPRKGWRSINFLILLLPYKEGVKASFF